VHTDLLAARRIPDPFHGDNEMALRWIAAAGWQYRRAFDAPGGRRALPPCELVCEGLDTAATLRLNGRRVGAAENMFRRYVFDLSGALERGRNVLDVAFESPLAYGRRRSGERPYEVPGAMYYWPTGEGMQTYRNHVRKAQCQFGWDWGPFFPTMGVWRAIHLRWGGGPWIEHVTVRQQWRDGDALLCARVQLSGRKAAGGRVTVRLTGCRNAGRPADGRVWTAEAAIPGRDGPVEFAIRVEAPAVWYPAGYGGQPLYRLAVEAYGPDGRPSDRAARTVGFRTVQLVREPDAFGESFFFRVNGVPVFAKGANWVPADPLPSRITPARYEFLLRSAAAAHMNMLRVWGGGIFEPDGFYALCDRLGILVWQDYLFACCAYPGTDGFLANVAEEVRHQIRRLQHHPSIVLWCGGNEYHRAYRNWGHPPHERELARDARRLARTLERVTREEDPSRPYIPTSPVPGHTLARGDAHPYYHLNLYREQADSRRYAVSRFLDIAPRFCSEFGFQSLPAPRTLRTVLPRGPLDLSAPAAEHHQRKVDGTAAILFHVAREFRWPRTADALCYLSQLKQALVVQEAVAHWRRSRPRTMGTLYWQLEDCWPVVSWAGIDSAGRWKALHYFARRFYAPLLASFEDGGDVLTLWATQDGPEALACQWRLELWHTDGRRLARFGGDARVPAAGSGRLGQWPVAELLGRGSARTNAFLVARVRAGRLTAEALHVLAPHKALALQPTRLSVSVRARPAGHRRVTVSAERPALYVALDAGDAPGVFTDNYFALLPGRPRTVEFTPSGPTRGGRAPAAITARSLRETYA
jgi:beta-mannosidase